MTQLYDNKFKDNFNIEIDGISLFAENISPEESYNRRETNTVNILGGTQYTQRTNYIAKKFSFTTHLLVEPDRPDVYDKLFQEWMSKPCEIISPEMGGLFNAEVIVKTEHTSPSTLTLTITVTELPEQTSNIPNDSFTIPEDKLETEEHRLAREAKAQAKKDAAEKARTVTTTTNNTITPHDAGAVKTTSTKN